MSNIIKSSYVVQDKSRIGNSNNIITPIKKDVQLEEKILDDAKKEYERIVNEARAEAKRILEDARQESERYIDDAYAKSAEIIGKSKKQGYEEGYSEGKTVSDQLIEEANQYKKEYYSQREMMLNELEEDVITLVLDICDKVFGEFIGNNEEAILPIISKGINSLNAREKVVIRVSKDDYEVVEMYKDRVLAMANLVEDIEVKCDNSLSAGGCIIETSKGSVDTSMETQLNEIKDILKNLLIGE